MKNKTTNRKSWQWNAAELYMLLPPVFKRKEACDIAKNTGIANSQKAGDDCLIQLSKKGLIANCGGGKYIKKYAPGRGLQSGIRSR